MKEGILNYLRMESTGALMVSGEWGCGKTYYINHEVIPALKEAGYTPIMVSLFGIESVYEIPLKIAENYHYEPPKGASKEDKKGWRPWTREKAGKAAAKGGSLVSSITWLESFVDIKTLVNKSSGLLYKLIPRDNTVIFLDDIERAIDSVKVYLLLGAINGLVEQKGYKVVVIANNSYIQQKGADELVFKEKVIEKTLVYEPDVVSIYNELCQGYASEGFKYLMTQDGFSAVIDPAFTAYSERRALQADLHNIRIVKFALSHFYRIYEAYEHILASEVKTPAAKSFLLSLWAQTVGLSVAYKKNHLSYKDRAHYAGYVDITMGDWQLYDGKDEPEEMFSEKQEKDTNEEEERDRVVNEIQKLFDVFVKGHNLPIVISSQVFDFITAGVSLDEVMLKNTWDNYKQTVERNTVSPAYELLNRFMLSQWSMTNDEMKDAILRLIQFVENGDFSDNMAYVNSTTYLLHFKRLLPFDENELKSKIRAGIDKMYARIRSLNILDQLNLNVVEAEIPIESRWVIDYEREKMNEIEARTMADDIKEVCRQFNEDLPALEKRLTIQYNSTKTPDFADYPILKHIPEKDVIKKFQDIQPVEVMSLYYILNSRFVQMTMPKRYDEELTFVRSIKKAIAERLSVPLVYSDILIEDHLVKLVERILPKK